MGKTISETINSFMPTSFNKDDEFYKAFIADADNDTGAVVGEIKDVTEFINYFTNPQKIDNTHTFMLEAIARTLPGLLRRYSEPDEHLRLRYKALVIRNNSVRWNSEKSIKGVFAYFFPEKDIHLIERYPVNNLIKNGGFESLDSWVYDDSDTEFRLIYSQSFTDGSAMYINPDGANSAGYMEQQVPSVPAGYYEFLLFFSSPKKGIGDIEFSIRDGAGRYWNGSSWINKVFDFYEKADVGTPGYYKPIQKNISIAATSNITFRFKNVNGNGVLIDSVRFGKISEPAFKVYITIEPNLFFDGSFLFNKQYNFSGFKEYYIQADMEYILKKIKPAGVYAEMDILSSRLNIPWDRILLRWETIIKTYWHLLFDGSKSFNSGGVRFEQLYFNAEIDANSEYRFDGLKMIRYSSPNDLLWGPPMISHNRTYKRKSALQLKRNLYFDGKIGANGKYNFAGEVIGIALGYSYMKVTKFVKKSLIGQAVFDGMYKANGEIKFDGRFIYYQTGTETYYVKEVS